MARAHRLPLALGLTAAAMAVSALPALANSPAMTTRVQGDSVTVLGACARGGTEADAWYGHAHGLEPEEIGEMADVGGGRMMLTFTGLQPGAYIAVMSCDGDDNTTVRGFTIRP